MNKDKFHFLMGQICVFAIFLVCDIIGNINKYTFMGILLGLTIFNVTNFLIDVKEYKWR